MLIKTKAARPRGDFHCCLLNKCMAVKRDPRASPVTAPFEAVWEPTSSGLLSQVGEDNEFALKVKRVQNFRNRRNPFLQRLIFHFYPCPLSMCMDVFFICMFLCKCIDTHQKNLRCHTGMTHNITLQLLLN